jgi:hypothetical protein
MMTARSTRVLKIIPSVIAFCLICTATQAKYSGGTGEPNDPYQIATAEDLMLLSESTEDYDKHFIMTADIDLDPNLPGRKVFNKAIVAPDTNDVEDGFQGIPFTGIFEGNGHKIFNFISTSTDSDFLGVFGYMNNTNTRICNLGLINSYVDALNGSNVGSLVGWLAEGIITNCFAEDGRVSGDRNVGGIVGSHGPEDTDSHSPSSLISNCYSTSHVSGKFAVGGFAGDMRPGSKITDSHAIGNIYGQDKSSWLGGFVGCNNYGMIERCYATGDVSVENIGSLGSLGGFVGRYINGRINSCYAKGNISTGDSSKRLGGFVGHIDIGPITNCYANGAVSAGRDSRYVGGFVGYNDAYGTIDSCYATGHLQVGEGTRNVGGLVGFAERSVGYGGYGLVAKCFWDIQTSGIQTSAGGIGLTTIQMMDTEVYSLNGWAGNPNWIIDAGNDYPHLVWEGKTGEPIPNLLTDWFIGTGTQADPYQIATAEQLVLIAKAPILWDKCFVLVSDLDLATISIRPIGVCAGNEFAGIFNGNGYVISNLGVGLSEGSTSSSGLFGYISKGGQVTRLRFEGAAVVSGDNSLNLGILANANYGTISDCNATGSVSAGNSSNALGGLVGMNRGTITTSCAAARVVSGESSSRIGGFVGQNWGIITFCHVKADISSGRESRGLGGLSGSNEGNNKALIANCYAVGYIDGAESCRELGGLVGFNLGAKINSSYSAVAVNTENNSFEFSGLLGDNVIDGTIEKCYFLASTDEDEMVNGFGLALTDEQLKQQASFIGWDFIGETANGTDDTWWIDEGRDYPRLWWELTEVESD